MAAYKANHGLPYGVFLPRLMRENKIIPIAMLNRVLLSTDNENKACAY